MTLKDFFFKNAIIFLTYRKSQICPLNSQKSVKKPFVLSSIKDAISKKKKMIF